MASCDDPVRVYLIDDHQLLRDGLRMLINAQQGLEVVGEAGGREEALAGVSRVKPDVVLLDVDLGNDDGLELLPYLIDRVPSMHVIMLTGVRDPEVHRRAVLMGAMGLVLKEKAAETVLRAIEKVCAGEVWLDRTLIASILNERARGQPASHSQESEKIARLTDREREVIALVGDGLRNRQICERLVISEATVRHHLTSIFSKLNVADRFELAVYAYRHHLAEVPK
jgi:DNA-binding NarL/FixJ family response regulator